MADLDEAGRRFAANLRVIREQSGVSQAELAERAAAAGYPFVQQTIHKIESGGRKVALGEAIALAAALNSSVDALTMPPGLVRQAWEMHSQTRRLREAHTEIAKQARRFRGAREWLERALRKAAEGGYAGELEREISTARHALELSLEDAIREEAP